MGQAVVAFSIALKISDFYNHIILQDIFNPY